jgi:hypothetical protein
MRADRTIAEPAPRAGAALCNPKEPHMARILALTLACLLAACGGSGPDEPDDMKTIEPVPCLAHDSNPNCAH